MALISYQYSKAAALDRLTLQIQTSSIITALDHIDLSGTSLTIWFKSTLSSADKTTLDTIVANHVATPLNSPETVQPIGSSTLKFKPRNFKFAPTLAGTSTFDYALPASMAIMGLQFYPSNITLGDVLTVDIVDTNNVLGTGGSSTSPVLVQNLVGGLYLFPGNVLNIEDLSASTTFQAGLVLRIKYTALAAVTASVYCNIFSYE